MAGIAIMFWLPIQGRAAKPYTPANIDPLTEPYRWQLITELSGKSCRCMVEDRNQTMWFGVKGGVLAYNGIHWQMHVIEELWQNEPVVGLCAASDGSIYAGSPKGICRFSQGKWQNLNIHLDFADTLDYPNNKYPILETADHSIWIGTHQGLLRIQNQQMALHRPEGIFPSSGKKTLAYVNETLANLPLCNVYSLFFEKPNYLWVGLTDGSIFRLFSNDSAPNPIWKKMDDLPHFNKGEFPSIIKNKNDVYVVNQESQRGISIFNGAAWHYMDPGVLFGVDNIHTDLLSTQDGSLWVGGLEHLYVLKNSQWQIYDATELPLPANRLFLYETHDGTLWIGGLGSEIWRVDLSTLRWTTLKELNYQGESRTGDKWFLTYDGRIVVCDNAMRNWRSFDVSDGLMDTPTAILIARNDRIWAAGSHGQTAATAFFDGRKWQRQLHSKLGWGIDYRAVYETRDGSVWFGVSSDPDIVAQRGYIGGLTRCRPPFADSLRFEYHYFNEQFSLYGIYAIGQGADDRLWAGQLGLYQYDEEKNHWQKITSPRGLVENFIDCMFSTSGGDLWFGSRSNGLFWLNGKTGQWTNFTAENSLSSNTIVSICCQSDSSVWVATDQDICHFDGKSWVANVFPAHIKMTSSGGSMRMAADGSLWINQLSRIWNRRALYPTAKIRQSKNSFRTIRYQPDKQPPETVITFSQDRISQPGNVLLSWSAHDSWKATPDQQLRYSYRMDGQPWSDYTTKTSEIFLAVADGNHTFAVRARDRDLNVDPTPAQISFYVMPPTWRQTWFIALIIAFLATISAFVLRLIHRNRIIRELSDARQKLFTNVSHEFRTPLTLLLGPLQQMRKILHRDHPLRQQVELMQRNGLRLLRLVNQVLDFQKIEAGRLYLEPSLDDVMGFISQIASSFDSIAKEKRITFQVEISPVAYRASFDPDKLEKIIYNLLANAFKFTSPKGQVHLKAVIAADHQPDPRLEMVIRDSGIGIPQKELTNIFDRFYQVDNHAHRHRGGTGIGLNLVKELVSLHNGTIRVESEENKGTTFYVTLVLNSEASAEIKGPAPAAPDLELDPVILAIPKPGLADKDSVKKPLILLVEDNEDMRQFIRQDLQPRYRILEAETGSAGLALASRKPVDLIISDIMMPEMDGIEFCKRIKTDERFSHIPVILLTARSSFRHKMEGLETGADDYITKPFHTRELEIRVRNLIQTRRLLRERFRRQMPKELKEVTVTSMDEKFLRRAMEIVEKRLDNPDYTVDLFSRDMAMSRVGLYHKLKALTDQSVQEFIFSLRLKRAAQLLQESGLTVTEVAFQVGFKDSSHFTKLFKKQFGAPPSSFRPKT